MVDRIVSADPTGGPDRRATLPPMTAAARLVVVVRGEHAVERGAAILAGGLTPTELFSTWDRGAAAVKVFPAGQVGPRYVADLRGPFPDIAVVPSGGVDLDSARAWLAAGAAAVSVGGPILGDALAGGGLDALAARARRFVELCAGGGAA